MSKYPLNIEEVVIVSDIKDMNKKLKNGFVLLEIFPRTEYHGSYFYVGKLKPESKDNLSFDT